MSLPSSATLSLSPAWSSSVPPGRRNLMPNNLMQLRSGAPPRGRNGSIGSTDKMPSVSSRRVVPKNQDLSPSPGLPRANTLSNMPSNNSNGNLSNIPPSTSPSVRTANKASAHGNDKHGRFPQFDERRQDMLRPSQQQGYLRPTHQQHQQHQQQQQHLPNHQPSTTNHQSDDCPQLDTKVSTPPSNKSRASSHNNHHSTFHNYNNNKGQKQHDSSSANSPGSSVSVSNIQSLKQREESVLPKDPRVKFDPKLTMSSHHHAVSSTSSDDRVQLRIAVEELRLIVKWREQQQQELQKRVGKLAGKYNKLLDLYISEKDRAESAFAKLQKQLREFRSKEQESTRLVALGKIEKEKNNEEIEKLKDQLELEKQRYETESNRLSNHIDGLNSKVRALSKKNNERESNEASINKLTDSAFCRWQSYPDNNGINNNSNSNKNNMNNNGESIDSMHPRPPRSIPRRSMNIRRKSSSSSSNINGNGNNSGSGNGRSTKNKKMSNKEEIGDEEDVAHRKRDNTISSDEESDEVSEDDDREDTEEDMQESKGSNNSNHDINNVETLTSKRGRNTKNQHRKDILSSSSAPPLPNSLQLQLDQAAIQLEIVKCELQWRTQQAGELQEKLTAKTKMTSGVDVNIQTKSINHVDGVTQTETRQQNDVPKCQVISTQNSLVESSTSSESIETTPDAVEKKVLCCGKCEHTYIDPVILVPCGHSFCGKCVEIDGKTIKNCFQCENKVLNVIKNKVLNDFVKAKVEENKTKTEQNMKK